MAVYEDDALYSSGGSDFNNTLDEASSALDKVGKKAEEADRKLSSLGETFDSTGESAKEASEGFNESAQGVGRFNKSLQPNKLSQYASYMQELNKILKEMAETNSSKGNPLDGLSVFNEDLDSKKVSNVAKSIDKIGNVNIDKINKLNDSLQNLSSNLDKLNNLNNLNIKISGGGGDSSNKSKVDNNFQGELESMILNSLGGLGKYNKILGGGIDSVLGSISKSKDLKNLSKEASKFAKSGVAASKGMAGLAGGVAGLASTAAVAIPVITAVAAALGVAIKAGQEYHKVNLEMARSLEMVNDAQSESGRQAIETANKLVDVKNQWTRIGEDLTSVFEPLFNLAVDFVSVIGNAIESVTDTLDKTNDKNYTMFDSKFKWYTQGLEGGSGEPESTSLPVLGDIASSAKQSGFTNQSAANLAIGTYDTAMELAHKYGQEASKVAQDLADAWLTGSDAAKEYGIVVNDQVLAGYMASQGVDIVNVEITDAMKQYYRYQLMMEQAAQSNSDAMSEQIKDWTQLGAIIDKTKGKLFSFDEVINMEGFDPTIPEVGTPDVDMSQDTEEPDKPDDSLGTAVSDGKTLMDLLNNIGNTLNNIYNNMNGNVQENTTIINNNTQVINNNTQAQNSNAQANNSNSQATNSNTQAINNNNMSLQGNVSLSASLSNITQQLNGFLQMAAQSLGMNTSNTNALTQSEMALGTQMNTSTGYLVNLNTSMGQFTMMATSATQAGQIASQAQQLLGSSFLGCSVQTVNTTGTMGQFSTVANIVNSVTGLTIQLMAAEQKALEGVSDASQDASNDLNELDNSIVEVGNDAMDSQQKVLKFIRTLSDAVDAIQNYYDALNNTQSNRSFGGGSKDSLLNKIKAQGSIKSSVGEKISSMASEVKSSFSAGGDLFFEAGDIMNSMYDQGGLTKENLAETLYSGMMGGALNSGEIMSNMFKQGFEKYGDIPFLGTPMAVGHGLLGNVLYGGINIPGIIDIKGIEDWSDVGSNIDLWAKLLRDKTGVDLTIATGAVSDLLDYGTNWVSETFQGEYANDNSRDEWVESFNPWGPLFPVLNEVSQQMVHAGMSIDKWLEEEGHLYGIVDAAGGTVMTDAEGNPIPGYMLKNDENRDVMGLGGYGNKGLYPNNLYIPNIGEGRQFASGGIGTKEINNATLFEGNKAEAVIPLESREGIDFLAKALEEAGANSESQRPNITINLTLQGIFDTDDPIKWNQLVTKLAESIDIQTQRHGSLGYGASY